MTDDDPFGGVSTMRLYGGAVGVVSGTYSVWLALDGAGMGGGAGWVMALVGLVALVHGLALFTPVASSIGRASGPLMMGYAAVMLLLQAWAELTDPMDGGMGGMDGTMGGTVDGMMVGADAGMLALALLMLFSGVVMTLRREMLD